MARQSRSTFKRAKAEPTIALINIVFLMLIFFMIAGTLAAPLDKDLKLVSLSELEGKEPPDTLMIFPDGQLKYRGQATTIGDELERAKSKQNNEDNLVIKIIPDEALKAVELIDIANELRAQGAKKVIVVTKRALQ